MATRDIETWTEVHDKGDGRKPWNKGKPYRGTLPSEQQRTDKRRNESRTKWVSEAAQIVGYTVARRALEEACNG